MEVNCTTLPKDLIEAELFGYEKGAYTGATESKPGLAEAAEGGTLFLDEVGELPLAVQSKLLQLIEHKTVRRLGGCAPAPSRCASLRPPIGTWTP